MSSVNICQRELEMTW